MKKIFINYSWTHHATNAQQLCDLLAANKEFKVWMDKKDLPSGMKFKPAIRKAIRDSDFFISILSKESIKGRGVRNAEIYEALDVLKLYPPNEIYLIPARVDDCDPPFEEMHELNWVNLFPDWDQGCESLLKALGINKPIKKILKAEKLPASASKCHYRVGVVDLDVHLANMPKLLAQLNKAQEYFFFTSPKMPALRGVTEVIDGSKNFAVFKVPKSYVKRHPHLMVDLLACVTKYPLAFEEDDELLYDYFAGPSEQDERFLFVSLDHLKEFTKEAGCSFEEGIVYILVGQLVEYFTNLGYHKQTRGCVMDFCEDRHDLVVGLKKRAFCKSCSKSIPAGDLKNALMKLLEWKYGRK